MVTGFTPHQNFGAGFNVTKPGVGLEASVKLFRAGKIKT